MAPDLSGGGKERGGEGGISAGDNGIGNALRSHGSPHCCIAGFEACEPAERAMGSTSPQSHGCLGEGSFRLQSLTKHPKGDGDRKAELTRPNDSLDLDTGVVKLFCKEVHSLQGVFTGLWVSVRPPSWYLDCRMGSKKTACEA